MKKKQFLLGLAFAFGLFFVAGYSIDNRGFHSSIFGIIGCLLLVTSYIGFFWPKIKAGDKHARHLTWLLTGLVLLIIALDIAEAMLA